MFFFSESVHAAGTCLIRGDLEIPPGITAAFGSVPVEDINMYFCVYGPSCPDLIKMDMCLVSVSDVNNEPTGCYPAESGTCDATSEASKLILPSCLNYKVDQLNVQRKMFEKYISFIYF